MSLQVIGPPSTGSKAVLWAESRLPRQTWSISESGHICSQMFEGRTLDVKGKGAGMWEKAPERGWGGGVCSHWGPKKHLPISPSFCQVAGATTGTTRCCGSWPRTGRPRSGPSMCSDTPTPFPSPGGFPWDEMFFVGFCCCYCCNISCFLICSQVSSSLCTLIFVAGVRICSLASFPTCVPYFFPPSPGSMAQV